MPRDPPNMIFDDFGKPLVSKMPPKVHFLGAPGSKMSPKSYPNDPENSKDGDAENHSKFQKKI